MAQPLPQATAGRLEGQARQGVPRTITDEKIAEVVRMTLEEKPPDATHWSTHSMAREMGMSP